ncbi:MAG TPA: zeta toxin family protein [Longimicrobiaceae bacterium]|nr:zeta toxin family protein [Longimicrobiaceae bacterium]
MTGEPQPHAVIVAGPNGAGKSTMAPRVVAKEFGITVYVNPDVIAQGLAGFDPASAGIRAGRIMHERLEELRVERTSFAVESTISGRSLQRVIRNLTKSGYRTLLFYLWLPEPDLAVGRVRKRVTLGGHHVPEEDIRRRLYRSIVNFETVYRRITSEWRVYHALQPYDDPEPRLIAYGVGDAVTAILDDAAWEEIRRQVLAHSQEEP